MGVLFFLQYFMLHPTEEECKNLMSQFATSSWGGRKTPPFMFTKQGVATLFTVPNSPILV
ncbi:ORF6N domain-containing protein [Aquiflexum sp. TKW24L]|uniref:ORF6N domain-containing protein n=1 Tax=Aquiflexum sp. TKW24L TaxID=2942212 RepID=UPI0032DF868C